MADTQNVLYSWDFDDTKERNPLWYMVALSIAIWLIIWGFLTRQYGMSVVVMLIVGFFYFLENNADEQSHIDITDLWIKVQNTFYDYARIHSFSLVYSGDQAVYLRLHLKKRSIGFMNIRVDNSIASHIRSILPNYIEENSRQEISLLEKITHLLKL